MKTPSKQTIKHFKNIQESIIERRMKMPSDLSKARILLTNDDGIDAPGLAVLERIARQISDDVWICAPTFEQSAASHSLTIHDPLRIREHAPKRFSVDGTPTDSVLMAMAYIMKDNPPDLVLSGVNRGCNIADDVTYSGTISAAMEATIFKIPAIALSLDMERDGNITEELYWDTPMKWGARTIRAISNFNWPSNVMMNVNFPPIPPEEITGIEACYQGERDLEDNLYRRTDPRGKDYFWIGPIKSNPKTEEGSDITSLTKNKISVTPLRLNLTDWKSLEHLHEILQEEAVE